MKPRADFYETFKGEMIASKKMKNRLIKYWGTEIIDGVEVFKKTFDTYPNSTSKGITMITNLFGMTRQIQNGNFDGVDRYYLKFNPEKQKKVSEYAKDIITNKINTYMAVGETKTVDLNIYDPSDPAKFVDFTTKEILDYVKDDYETLLDSNYIESRGNTILENTLGIYVLLDDGTHFKVTATDGKVRPVANTKTVGTGDYAKTVKFYTSSISLSLTYTMLSHVTDSSAIVEKIHIENEQLRASKIKLLLESASNKSEEDLLQESDIPVTNALWYKDQLRVELTDAYTFDSKEFADIVASTLDTGYVKKKPKGWKKLITPILLIIAVVLAAITAGQSLTAFAFYMGVSSVVLAGIQYALAESGDTVTASYMGRAVQISGIISTVAGIGAMIANMGKEIARQGLVQAAQTAAVGAVTTASTVVTTAVQQVGTQLVQVATTTTVRELSITKIASLAVKVVLKIIEQREKMKAKDLEAQISEVRSESEALATELSEMEDKTLHIGVEDIKWYTSPLTVENSQYKVDYQYEGAGHNILRPSFYTAQALNIRT